MKVLFVASGNSSYYDVAPFIQSQAEALRASGVDVAYFLVKGKGLINYLSNARKLRQHLARHPYDLIHAHYGLCGAVAVLARPKVPVVLSLMGDDIQGEFIEGKVLLKSRIFIVISRLVLPFVQSIIVKSPNLAAPVPRRYETHVIPNGVRLDQFKLMGPSCREELGFQENKQYVLFLGDPADSRKNIALAKAAIEYLAQPDIELVNLYRASHDEVVKYLNAADVFVLCSYGEGSPNVVKEAMACNCPMVATDVGDVRWVIEGVPGCHISSFKVEDFADKLDQTLRFAQTVGRTNGRQRILDRGLDAEAINERLLEVYRSVLPVSAEKQPLEYE